MQTKAPVASRQATHSGRAFVPFQAGRKVAKVAAPSSSSVSSASTAMFSSAKLFKQAGSVSRGALQTVCAIRDGQTLDRPLRVAVIGGGPSGACAAETLAAAGIETYLIERKLDNCKVRFAPYYSPLSHMDNQSIEYNPITVMSLRSPAEVPSPSAWSTSSSCPWKSSTGRSPR